jgi:hypothetical protein
MTRRKPDRGLRRALAELRRMGSEDRNAIVDLLAPADRLRIERLMRGDAARSAPTSQSPSAPFAAAGYSDWLLQRLDHAQPEGMTAEAAALLLECAREGQDAAGSIARPREAPGLARLAGLLRKARHAA